MTPNDMVGSGDVIKSIVNSTDPLVNVDVNHFTSLNMPDWFENDKLSGGDEDDVEEGEDEDNTVPQIKDFVMKESQKTKDLLAKIIDSIQNSVQIVHKESNTKGYDTLLTECRVAKMQLSLLKDELGVVSSFWSSI